MGTGDAGTIYLDHASDTRVDVRVLDAMAARHATGPGNPHSRMHAAGRDAGKACDDARERISRSIGALGGEVVFTGSATESNNLAIAGTAACASADRRRIVTCVTEHSSVLEPCRHLERSGFELTLIGVDRQGRIDLARLARALDSRPALVSVMWVNNEIGTIQDIGAVGRLAAERGVRFHCDAVQALGRVPIDVEQTHVDLLTISGHKIGGPAGSAALWVRHPSELAPIVRGGGQQNGLRSGTVDVAGAIGLALACEIAVAELALRAAHLRPLRERLLESIRGSGIPFELLSAPDAVPGIVNIAFANTDAEALLARVEARVALSTGSACESMRLEPSHVLSALGIPLSLVHAAVRFSPGPETTLRDIDDAVACLLRHVELLRTLNPNQEAS